MEFALLADYLLDMNEVLLLRRWAGRDIIASTALTDARPSISVDRISRCGQINQEVFVVVAIEDHAAIER